MPKLAISRFDKYRLVTDRRTDGQRDGQTHDDSKYRASIASRGKKISCGDAAYVLMLDAFCSLYSFRELPIL